MAAKKNCSAMIVDDAFYTRNLLRSILEIEGYTVVAEAENGEDAVAKYRVSRPDLVLMDLIMPVKSGIDATRDIICFDKNACVVMCSLTGQDPFVRAAREAGARGFIVKPLTAEDITATLQQVMAAKFEIKKEVNR